MAKLNGYNGSKDSGNGNSSGPEFSKSEIIKIILASVFIIAFFAAVVIIILKYDSSAPSESNVQQAATKATNAPLPQTQTSPNDLTIEQSEQILNAPLKVQDNKNIKQVKYYKKNNARNIKFISGEINGINVEFIFDTGASDIALNAETIKKLGIKDFSKTARYKTAGGIVVGYKFVCSTIKVGDFEIKDVDCAYNPSASENLLGGTFLTHFNYYIDELTSTITLVPKSEKAELVDGELRIPKGQGYIEIDGKKYQYDEGKLKKVE